jgi:hypothetical protein
MVGLLAKKGIGCYLFPYIGKVAENPEQLFQLTTSATTYEARAFANSWTQNRPVVLR